VKNKDKSKNEFDKIDSPGAAILAIRFAALTLAVIQPIGIVYEVLFEDRRVADLFYVPVLPFIIFLDMTVFGEYEELQRLDDSLEEVRSP